MANRGGAQRPNGSTQGKICQFKLVLLGESAVGKSSLVLRFVKGQFHEYQESTIGGHIWSGQIVGERAPETSLTQHCDCFVWQQGGPGQQAHGGV
uniref:Uncharacterized protein n=1 Tax=Timema poppense TaxID=170557 RepID=A0A7R9GU30_TIMPO|nr:unnamed protein product [Timema poppensis]